MPRSQKPAPAPARLLPSLNYPPSCGMEMYWTWPEERRNIQRHNNFNERVRVGTVHSVRETTVYTKAPPGFGATFELKFRCGYIQHVSFSEMTVGIVQHNKWVSTRLVKQIAARTVALQEAVQVTEKQPGNGESVAGAMRSKDDSASTDESDSASEEDTNEE